MIASYPNQDADKETQDCWTADWTEVVLHYGAEVLTEALRRHRKASNFLPSAHDLTEQVVRIKEERNSAEAAKETNRTSREYEVWKSQYFEEQAAGRQIWFSCESCEGTGIHMTHRDGRRYIINPKRNSCPSCAGAGLIRDAIKEQDAANRQMEAADV